MLWLGVVKLGGRQHFSNYRLCILFLYVFDEGLGRGFLLFIVVIDTLWGGRGGGKGGGGIISMGLKKFDF